MFPTEIKEQPTQPSLYVRFRARVEDLPSHFAKAYSAISQYLAELGETPAGGVYAAYYNLDMQNLDIEAGFTVSRPLLGKGDIRSGKIPAGRYAICHYTGPYDQMGPAMAELMQFAKEKGYTTGTVYYEWYLNGPETPPQDLKTDISIPVMRVPEAKGV
jgi:effector-binding domain-containing protein